MPELPEVEAARRAVQEHCCGKTIVRAQVANDPKVIVHVTPADFEKTLAGKKLIAAHRKGKNMWLQLDSPPFPSFQFGMTGAVFIKGVSVTKYKRSVSNDEDEWPSKYSKVFIEFEDGVDMSFTDTRRFARVRLLTNPEAVPPISELGHDALLELMPVETFSGELRKKKIAIKTVLLDQNFLSGIGNWVADEVLYQAKIHPAQLACSLSEERCKALHDSIKQVINWAVQVDADSEHFPSEWIFHYRWARRPGEINGKKIDFITIGGRTSAYVPELQKWEDTSSASQSAKDKGNADRKKSKDESSSSQRKMDKHDLDGGTNLNEVIKSKTKVQKKTGRRQKHGRLNTNEEEEVVAGKRPIVKRAADMVEPTMEKRTGGVSGSSQKRKRK